ncbi:MAG: trypsin-like peptidase domain-containing protein [Candidatus Ornithomonoglobus sp.]
MKKKIVSAALLCTIALSQTALAQNVDIYVNGRIIGQQGYLADGTTYVPLRAVSEALGAAVDWDGQSVHVAQSEDELVSSLIESVSESVVAVVGNYKGKTSSAASDYNELTAHGTGVVIKSNGLILTNAHVVSDIENITVVFNDGTSYAGTVEGIDKTADLATVRINRLGLKPVTFKSSSAELKPGNTVIAIGTPISLSMRNSATKGIISGLDVKVSDSFYPLIQTDAAINPGNSGGPLIDLTGAVVGINSSKYAAVGIEGMAFSIPVETINYVLNQFEKNGAVLRPDISASFDESWEARIGLPTTKGITVKNSTSPELQNGDIVTAVNGVAVHSIIDYNKAVRDTFTDTLTMTVTRGGAEMSLNVSYTLK